jgi:FkbM family methyltransferase
MLNHGRSWDEHVFAACRSLMSSGGAFYDIGANVGYMSIEMAAAFQDEVTVAAFEPQPALARAIALSARLNRFRRLEVFDLMVGDRNGEAELYLARHSIHASSKGREQSAKRLRTSMATLDSIVTTCHLRPPSVIKLDIEGGELAAILGAAETITRFRPSVVFEADENQARFGYGLAELIDCIRGLAPFEFFWIEREVHRWIPIGDVISEFWHGDYIARPLGKV